MSDLPAGVSESIFYEHPDGRVVELLGYRREPNCDYPGKPKKKSRKRLPGSVRFKRAELIERDGMYCHYCDLLMHLPHKESDLNHGEFTHRMVTLEHVVPRSHGGSNHMHNLVLACGKCNHSLGSQLIKCRCDFCNNARMLEGMK